VKLLHQSIGLFTKQAPFMAEPSKISFSNGLVAESIQLKTPAELAFGLHQLGLEGQHPALVLIGGASKLSDADFHRLQMLFIEVLAPLAQKWQAVVIDGGTDAGVMRLMGQARSAICANFPLLGVTPLGLVTLPTEVATTEEAAPLEPHHTHFIFVPGSQWGDESVWIASVASAIADSASVTVLINGGEITWKDASQSVKADRSIIVIAGSGRTADVLAAALYGDSDDERAESLVASGLIRAIDLDTGAETLATIIEDIFATKG
jgi:SLOG in TRPM, prokaryote